MLLCLSFTMRKRGSCSVSVRRSPTHGDQVLFDPVGQPRSQVPAGGRHIMEGSNLQAATKQNLQRTLPAKCHSGTNLLAEKK